MSTQITNAQIEAAGHGQPVDVRINDTDFVLVRKDVYEKAQQAAYDPSEWSEAELRATLARSAQSSDWNDDAMDIYDE